MVTTQILAKVGAGRLKKAVEGLVAGAYAITVTIQNEEEIRGFVLNGDNHQYGVVLTEGHTFCSCPHAMYRKTVCKHAVALALHVIRTPKMQTEAEENEEPKSVNTREELGLLLRTCQEHFPAPYPLISLLSRTGLRMGEALGLQWTDIDFHGRFIEVQRTLSNGNLTTPKSGKSRRVDLSLQLAETLKALLVEWKKETLRKG